MLQKTLINKNKYKKDIEKGQKIVAAVYLATDHIKDNNPIKDRVRALTLDLVVSEGSSQRISFEQISIVLQGATLCGLLSEKNTSIILYEMNRYIENEIHSSQEDESVSALFGDQDVSVSSPKGLHGAMFLEKKNNQKYAPIFDKKNVFLNKQKDTNTEYKKTDEKYQRKEKILKLINDKKSVVIKDITTLFPDVSEKTIQRELNSLIEEGRITKRGSKRWSIYMAVQTLL